MRSILLILIVLGTIPLILAKPHIGVLVWSWLSYMNPHRLTWGATYDFQFVQIIAILTLVSWVISREPKRIPLTPVTILLGLFVAWMTLTTLFALETNEATESWKFVMKLMLMAVVTLPLISTRQRLDVLIWVIVVSIGFYGIKGGLFVIRTGGQYTVQGPPESMLGANNGLALALIMVLPLMRYLQMQTTRRWIWFGLTGAMALSLLAILSTYSRGAVLALGAMLLVLWLKSGRKLVLGALGGLALLVGVSMMPDKWFERVESIQTYEEDWSAMDRLKMWKFGLNVALDRPIVGGGFDVFPAERFYERYGLSICGEVREVQDDCVLKPRTAHNSYVQVLGEHGFIGLALFLALGFATFMTGRSVIKRARGRPDLEWAGQLARMLQTSFVGFAAAGMFLNKAYFDLLYHLVAVMVITELLVSKALAAQAEEAAPVEDVPPVLSKPASTGPLARSRFEPGG